MPQLSLDASFAEPLATGTVDPLSFERRLEDLHNMLYRRGGIRPTNAAIEELGKLLLLRVQESRCPEWPVPGHGSLADVLSPARIRAGDTVAPVKAAFRAVIESGVFAARLPDGGSQPIWPLDEPLRIQRADVLAEALETLPSTIGSETSSGLDPLGTAFDVFLRGRYDHAGGLGTYLTPRTVAVTLAQLTLQDLPLVPSEPIPSPVFGDPCCGTGRFLLAVLSEISTRLGDLDPDSPEAQDFARFCEDGVFGADQSPSSIAKARVNLLLAGITHPYVFGVTDSITDPHIDALRGSLRLILTNPPFGEAKYDSDAGIRRTQTTLGIPGQRRRIDPAIAFFARCFELLADGGRLGIILPDGVVDGPVLRRALLETGTFRFRELSVEANISLPTATFALAGTVARTSALIVTRSSMSRSHVFLARADHVGYIRQAGAAAIDPEGDDLPDIAAAALKAWVATPAASQVLALSTKPLATLVPIRDLVSLDPGRVDTSAIDAQATLRRNGAFRLGAVLHRAPRRRAAPHRYGLPFVSVLHIDDLGGATWHQSLEYRPVTPGKPVQAGELIVSLINPSKLRATVIPDAYPNAVCSSEFGVFQTEADPYEVLVLLHHPDVRAQLAPLGRGTSSSRRRISESDVENLWVPALEPEVLQSRAAELRAALMELHDASLRAAAALTHYSESDSSVSAPSAAAAASGAAGS